MEIEAKKRQAEEAKNAEDRAKADQDREREKKEKELTALRKADAAPKRKATTANKKPSAEENKRKEKEEKARQDEENRRLKKRAEVEKVEVQKEVAVFNQKLLRVKNAFANGSSSIINMLKLADTNNDGRISLEEFMSTLQRNSINAKPDEILYIYEFIDTDKDGKLSYKELVSVLRGEKQIDPAEYIASTRKAKGLDHGYTPSEMENIQKGSKGVSFDKNEIRSVGEHVSMSSVYRNSEADAREVPALTDPDEHHRNCGVVREALLRKAISFEDVL